MNHADTLLHAALKRLREHIEDARRRGMEEANAASLATATPDGKPTVRTVYLMSVDDAGVYIATRLDSGKAAQMRANPAVSLCMVWPCLHRQLTLEGMAEVCEPAFADALWAGRMRDEQLAAWASERVGAGGRTNLRAAINAVAREFASQPVPRPDNWGGFRIAPFRIAEWPTGWHRSRQRIRIERGADGAWRQEAVRP